MEQLLGWRKKKKIKIVLGLGGPDAKKMDEKRDQHALNPL